VHFHFVVDGAGMYVHGNAIVDSMTRAVVIHEVRRQGKMRGDAGDGDCGSCI
jgi:hypothetical protein